MQYYILTKNFAKSSRFISTFYTIYTLIKIHMIYFIAIMNIYIM